jgi:hypothetical protein
MSSKSLTGNFEGEAYRPRPRCRGLLVLCVLASSLGCACDCSDRETPVELHVKRKSAAWSLETRLRLETSHAIRLRMENGDVIRAYSHWN